MVNLKFGLRQPEIIRLDLVRGIGEFSAKLLAEYRGENYVLMTLAMPGIYLHNVREVPFQVDDKKRFRILNEDIEGKLYPSSRKEVLLLDPLIDHLAKPK